ncbi:MAG: hypothetical protein JST39_02545 [Bacteroidetes bacterium]|nr:hypothetical protein [Bacteroidota bacterium]
MNQPFNESEFPAGDFVQGHLSAFENIYARFYPGVLRFARELVQGPVVSAQIVTDNFLKLWIQHPDLGNRQSIESFLHLGIQRSCFSYLKQVEQLTPGQLKKMSEADDSIAPEKTAAGVKAIILGWFHRLPSPTAEVARLLYDAGLDEETVAARLGMTADEVKMQKLKGMLLIKEQWFSKTERELAVFRDLLQKAKQY